jgi:hypothetical protein
MVEVATDDRPVSLQYVREALEAERFRSEPWEPWFGFRQHSERIAYLVRNGWNDPIELDIGVPGLGCYVDWPVMEGNHRLAAAIYRHDEYILAKVSGDIDYGFKLFGVDITE